MRRCVELALIARAIEEMLRYDGPVQSTVRHLNEDANVGGTLIAAKTMVFVILAAALTATRAIPESQTFDITRNPNEHVAFGEGIHFCIGAPLARIEGAIAIGSALGSVSQSSPRQSRRAARIQGIVLSARIEELRVTI